MIREESQISRIFSDSEPVPKTARKIDMVTARCGCQTRALLTSSYVVRCRTHWLGQGDSKPCLRHHGCPWCQAGQMSQAKGYLCGISTVTFNRCIVELTSAAMESCPELLDEGKELRGKVIVLTRLGNSTRGRAVARLEDPNGTLAKVKVPQEFDLVSALMRLWKFDPMDYESVDLSTMKVSDIRVVD